MDKSTSRVEIVPVVLEKHPDADTLSIVKVYNYQVVVRTEDWKYQKLGCYIPPDSIVPDRPEYAFLDGHRHIKVRKLRGVLSMGMLVPLSFLPFSDTKFPYEVEIGSNVAELLGITHYEPPADPISTGGQDTAAPAGYHPAYDVDSMYRYSNIFKTFEPVIVTEKVHGTNARFTFVDGEMFCGSHYRWIKCPEGNKKLPLWWATLLQYPEVEQFCRSHPGFTVYGEIYGMQDLRYGLSNGNTRLAVFDIMQQGGQFLGGLGSRNTFPQLPWVPQLGVVTNEKPLQENIKFNFEYLKQLSDGPSLVPGANHLREGIVVKPLIERTDPKIGRVQLKMVSNDYLSRNEKQGASNKKQITKQENFTPDKQLTKSEALRKIRKDLKGQMWRVLLDNNSTFGMVPAEMARISDAAEEVFYKTLITIVGEKYLQEIMT